MAATGAAVMGERASALQGLSARAGLLAQTARSAAAVARARGASGMAVGEGGACSIAPSCDWCCSA